jgi:hypothetical protein
MGKNMRCSVYEKRWDSGSAGNDACVDAAARHNAPLGLHDLEVMFPPADAGGYRNRDPSGRLPCASALRLERFSSTLDCTLGCNPKWRKQTKHCRLPSPRPLGGRGWPVRARRGCRSMQRESAGYFPENPDQAPRCPLVCRKIRFEGARSIPPSSVCKTSSWESEDRYLHFLVAGYLKPERLYGNTPH